MADPAELHRVGRFLVLEELGRGGMGVVLAAYDPDLDRKVAVKVLSAAPGSRPAERSEGRARLLREAQALARLSHPNVVTVHEVGTVGEQVFLAMELVRGQTLRQWVQQVSGPGAWRAIVAMFRQAGEGLAAAHRAGLVHRDFKPENVVVDAEGRARVLDFGLARTGVREGIAGGSAELGRAEVGSVELDPIAVTRPMPAADPGALDPPIPMAQTLPRSPKAASDLDTPLTEAGTVMGTPAYMAPEQHMGARVDARSDQFAFCVALYEALYDERPFDAATFADLRTRVLTGPPPSPSNPRDVPAWLLRVLLRGLQREPAARHASMDDVLEALDRDPGRRTRRTAAWATAALAVLGAGWSYRAHVEHELAEAREASDPCSDAPTRLRGIWDPVRKQEIHRAFSGTKLEYAADTWARVEARLDDYTTRWVAAQAAVCRATRVEHVQPEALLDVRQACLNSRLSELRAHATVFARADEHVMEAAIEGIEKLRDPDECRTVESMRVEQPLPEDADQAARVVELRQRLDDAEALTNAGKDAEAQAVAEAVGVEAEVLGYLPLVAEAQLAVGLVHERQGRYAEAVASFDRALWAAEVGRHDAAAVDVWSQWVRTVGYQQERHELARAMVPRLDAALHRLGPDVYRRATALRSLGTLAFAEGEHGDAVQRFEEALALLKSEPTPDPGQLSRAYQNLGTALYRVGRLDESAVMLGRSLELATAHYGPGHPRLAPTLQSLGGLARRRRDSDAAQRYYAQVLALLEAALPPTHPSLAANYRNLGDAHTDAGEHEQAIAWYRKALAADRLRLDEASPATAVALGHALLAVGQPNEAREHLEHAIAHASELSDDLGRLADARFDLARILWDADPPDRPRAIALAIAAHEERLVEGIPEEIDALERWLDEHRLR